jgi:hypothetical protein
VLEYYLSEINKGDSTPQITFEVLLKLLEEKYPHTKERFNQKYLELLALQATELPKSDETLIRKVLSEIFANSDIIGGDEQHKKDLRQKEEQEISPWLYCKFYKDRHLKRIKNYVMEQFYNLLHSLRSETNQPVHQDIIPQRSYTKRNRSDIETNENKPLKVTVIENPKPETTKFESKLPVGRPGRGTRYYLERKKFCEKGGINNKLCYDKQFRASKSKLCKLVKIAAENNAIYEHVKNTQLDHDKDEPGEVDQLIEVDEIRKADEQKERMKHTINIMRKAITDERIKNQSSTTLLSQRNLLDITMPSQVPHIGNSGDRNADSRQSIRDFISRNAQCGSSGDGDQEHNSSDDMSEIRRQTVQYLQANGSLFGACGEHVSTGSDEVYRDSSVSSSDFVDFDNLLRSDSDEDDSDEDDNE